MYLTLSHLNRIFFTPKLVFYQFCCLPRCLHEHIAKLKLKGLTRNTALTNFKSAAIHSLCLFEID